MATSNESGDTNIRDIIETHNQLSQAYQQIMRVIQRQGFFFCLQQQAQPAENAKRPHVVFSILWTYFIHFGSLYFYRVRTDKVYVIRPFVKYFLESHIRRQYQRLHDIYRSELTVGRAHDQEADVTRLRQIASDIENYSKIISHRKEAMTKFFWALSFIGTILGIFGVSIPHQAFLFKVSFVEPILRVLVTSHILIALAVSPLILAFLLKRAMFENSVTQQIQNYIFTGGPEADLLPRSVYVLENRLYELLGGTQQKPKEIPSIFLYELVLACYLLQLLLLYQY